MPRFQTQAETLPVPSQARGHLRRLWTRWVAMYRTHEERQELSRLDERDLRDIGANRLAARTEASRRFWDLPPAA